MLKQQKKQINHSIDLSIIQSGISWIKYFQIVQNKVPNRVCKFCHVFEDYNVPITNHFYSIVSIQIQTSKTARRNGFLQLQITQDE
jgi:hypothetical protein